MFARPEYTGRMAPAVEMRSGVTPGPCPATLLSEWTTTPTVTAPARRLAPNRASSPQMATKSPKRSVSSLKRRTQPAIRQLDVGIAEHPFLPSESRTHHAGGHDVRHRHVQMGAVSTYAPSGQQAR